MSPALSGMMSSVRGEWKPRTQESRSPNNTGHAVPKLGWGAGESLTHIMYKAQLQVKYVDRCNSAVLKLHGRALLGKTVFKTLWSSV